MLERKIICFLVIATFVCLAIIFVTTPQDYKNYIQLANTLSVGFVISAIFYFIVVYFPEWQRKSRVHRSLKRQYQSFKESCVDIFLILSNSQDYHNKENLLEQEEFKRYFKNNNKRNENRWSAVFNGMNDNEYYLNEIIYQLRILNDEIKFVRSSVDIQDEEVFSYLKTLSEIIHRMESTKPNYEDMKSLSKFLWEMFSGWSFIDSYRKNDSISKMIDRVK
jgi:hypothetical protein